MLLPDTTMTRRTEKSCCFLNQVNFRSMTFMTYWWEQSAVYTAPPPLPASCPTLWMGSQTQSAGYCGSSQSQFCGPPTPCHLDEVWHGSPGCRHTWSLGPLDSPVDTQDILSQPDSHKIPKDLEKQSIHFEKCAFFCHELGELSLWW